MQKHYVLNAAGLGDCFIRYFGLIPGQFQAWGKLASMKERTDCYIKAVLPVHNSAIIDFLRYHPFIDELQTMGYRPDWETWAVALEADGWTGLDEELIPYSQPPVYLGPGDEEWFSVTTKNYPYIVVHPYAGIPDRGLLDFLDFTDMPYPVFVIGGSSFRSEGVSSTYLDEFMPIGIKGSYTDLTGICNARRACMLIDRAEHFHGSFSAYAWAAIGCETPATIYLPDDYPNDDHTKLITKLGVKLRRRNTFPCLGYPSFIPNR